MHEITGNIWDWQGKAVIAITTNGSVSKNGRAVLGRGVTKQAAECFPGLADKLGMLVAKQGNHVADLGNGLVSFPVEETAWSQPDPRIIARSAEELRILADVLGWRKIIVPRPACGGGGFAWHDVQPLLAPWLDDRFFIITALPGSAA